MIRSTLMGYDRFLEEQIAAQEEPAPPLLAQAPALFRLLSHLMGDPALPARLRPLILAGLGYFVLPEDIMAEDLHGIEGLADDVFLAAFIANRVLQETGSETLLLDSWDGEGPLLPLLGDILAHESELIGDQRDLIFWFIGYEQLSEPSA